MKSKILNILEYAPIIIFFLMYKFFGMIPATSGLLVTTAISVALTYYIEKKISYMQIITFVIVFVMGGLTIYNNDTRFIKMKPTIVNLLFFLILIGGVFFNKGLMKYVLGQKFYMTDDNWILLSKRWALFFLFCGFLNELIWRNFSEEVWINFKAFGLVILTVFFIFFQMKFLLRNAETKNNLGKN